MPANALAVFAAKAPIEPTAPTQDRKVDNDFKDFMDNAVQKVESTQKQPKEDSPLNQSGAQAEKTQPHTTKAKSSSEDNPGYQEVSVPTPARSQSAHETVNKESLIEDTEVLAAQLKELDINQAQFEALLAQLGLNDDADINTLLQSLAQALNLNQTSMGEDASPADLIAALQQNKGEAVNLLKQAGLSEAEAKNFIDQLQSLQNASAQKELNKSADLQAKIDSRVRQSEEATAKNSALEPNQDDNNEELDHLAQIKNTTKETEKNNLSSKETKKPERSASADKLRETPKQNEAPRITNQEPVSDKGDKASNLNELMGDKNARANILQTESFTDSKGLKGLEAAKTNLDLQVQPPTATANTAVKAVESNKPVLPENLLARGATEAKIINQIADKMSVRGNGSENEVHVKLDPPSLGTVRMKITTSGDTVRTVIVAENHAVKQVIENNFNQLRDAMNGQGLKVDSFTVTVGGESGHQNPSGEFLGKENNPSLFEQKVSADTNENLATGTVSMFFGDNQSISVIA
jgi:flagellar hook-length control protein FliK